MVLEDVRGAEHQNAPRIDRHFLSGLRIAADATAFLAYRETAKRGYLHHLATRECLGDFVEDGFHEFCRLVARQPDLLIHGLAELSPRYRLPRHAPPPPLPETLNRAGKICKYRELWVLLRALDDLPADQARAPGKPTAHRLEQDQLTGADSSCLGGFRERQRHGCRRGIGMAVDGNDHLVAAEAEFFAHRIDDAAIGLMRHQPIDIARLQTIRGERFV